MLNLSVLLVALLGRLFNAQHFDAAYMRRVLVEQLVAQRGTTLVDSTCAGASLHHARYLSSTRTLSHYEEVQPAAVPLQYSINERGVDAEICLSYKAFTGYYELTYEDIAKTMVAEWLASPDHKDILLRHQLTKMGAAVVYNPGNDTFYGVVNFRY